MDAISNNGTSEGEAINYSNSINDMKLIDLKLGDCVITLGFYKLNDGGGAIYNISIIPNFVADDAFVIKLNNNLYANMIIKNDMVNIRQLGGLSEQDSNFAHIDNVNFINKYSVYIKLLSSTGQVGVNGKKIILFIPSGIWCFSETILNHQQGVNILGIESFIANGLSVEGTVITVHHDNQQFLWNVAGIGTQSIYNSCIKNIVFSTALFNNTNAYNAVTSLYQVTDYVLGINKVAFSFFDKIFFQAFNGKALEINFSSELYFGILNFRGGLSFTQPCMHITGVGTSALEFQSVMFEAVNGVYIKIENGTGDTYFGNINFEASFYNSMGESNNIISGDSVVYNYNPPCFDLCEAVGVTFNTLTCSMIGFYTKLDTNNKIYIRDSIFGKSKDGVTVVTVNSIKFTNYNKHIYVLNIDSTYAQSGNNDVWIIKSIMCYSGIQGLYTPKFKIIQYNGDISVGIIKRATLGSNEEITIPNIHSFFNFRFKQATNWCLYTDDSALSKTRICLRKTYNSSSGVSLMSIFKSPGIEFKLKIRVKIPTGTTPTLDLTYNGVIIIQDVTSTVVYDTFKWYLINTALPIEDTSIGVYDKHTYTDQNKAIVFDSFMFV